MRIDIKIDDRAVIAALQRLQQTGADAGIEQDACQVNSDKYA